MEERPEDKRNGLMATIALHVALLLLAIFFGLTQQIPAPEEGIAINFGYEEAGSGETEAAPEQQQQTPPPQESQIDEIATQETEEAPSITEENPKKPTEKPVEQPVEIPVEKQKQPSNALNRALNNTKGGTGEGEGNKEGAGDQGDPDGDRNSDNRTGGGGGNGKGNYQLGNRIALKRPTPNYNCPDQGRVVVKVWVDKNGKVLRAAAGADMPGVSTNTTSPCLWNRAQDAAMATTWQPSETAADPDVGFIIYNFKKQ